MKTKYFYPNKDGNIEFTREELEKLLNDVYNEGKESGIRESKPYIISIGDPIPTYQPTIIYNTPAPTWDYTKVYCSDDDSIGRTVLTMDTIPTTL
jgi:hypothetical protein